MTSINTNEENELAQSNYHRILTLIIDKINVELSNSPFIKRDIIFGDSYQWSVSSRTNTEVLEYYKTQLELFYTFLECDTFERLKEFMQKANEIEAVIKDSFYEARKMLKDIYLNERPSQRVELTQLRDQCLKAIDWEVCGVNIGDEIYREPLERIWGSIKKHNNRLSRINDGNYKPALKNLMRTYWPDKHGTPEMSKEEIRNFVKEEYFKKIFYLFKYLNDFPFNDLDKVRSHGTYVSRRDEDYKCVVPPPVLFEGEKLYGKDPWKED